MPSLELHSIVSSTTLEGQIKLVIDGKIISQWDVKKAKEICQMLHEAIEAAISDELIVKFLIKNVGLDVQKAVLALRDFRELRQGSKETIYPN
jgi:hypothetical protein